MFISLKHRTWMSITESTFLSIHYLDVFIDLLIFYFVIPQLASTACRPPQRDSRQRQQQTDTAVISSLSSVYVSRYDRKPDALVRHLRPYLATLALEQRASSKRTSNSSRGEHEPYEVVGPHDLRWTRQTDVKDNWQLTENSPFSSFIHVSFYRKTTCFPTSRTIAFVFGRRLAPLGCPPFAKLRIPRRRRPKTHFSAFDWSNAAPRRKAHETKTKTMS